MGVTGPQIKKHIVCSNTLRKLSTLQSSYHQLHPAASPRPPSFPFSSCFEVYFPTFSLEFFPSCSGWWRSGEEGNFEGSSILYYHTRLPSSPLNKALEETKQQKNCFLKGNYTVTLPQPMHPGQTNPHRPGTAARTSYLLKLTVLLQPHLPPAPTPGNFPTENTHPTC